MMRHRIILAALCPAMLGAVACSEGGRTAAADGVSIGSMPDDSVEILALELPVIPATISEPEDMAGFIAIHFWDNLDFDDMERVRDTVFMEQNFVDYLGVMPAVMASDRLVAFKALMERASANKEARELIVAFGEKYLNHPDSPMKNAEHYADFKKAAEGK